MVLIYSVVYTIVQSKTERRTLTITVSNILVNKSRIHYPRHTLTNSNSVSSPFPKRLNKTLIVFAAGAESHFDNSSNKYDPIASDQPKLQQPRANEMSRRHSEASTAGSRKEFPSDTYDTREDMISHKLLGCSDCSKGISDITIACQG